MKALRRVPPFVPAVRMSIEITHCKFIALPLPFANGRTANKYSAAPITRMRMEPSSVGTDA